LDDSHPELREEFEIKYSYDFIPIIVESYGLWNEGAIKFFESLAKLMAPFQDITYGEAIHKIYQRLSVSLMRRNVRMLRNRKVYSNRVI